MGKRTRYIFRICLSVSVFLNGGMALSAKRQCGEILQKQSTRLPKIRPIILRPLARLIDNPNNLYEMKYDGFRGVAYFEQGRRCRIISRNGKELSQFQSLCDSISEELDVQSAIFDGEVIAPDQTERPIFEKILRRVGPFQYVAFDLLWLNGEDLRPLPLKDRRQKLLAVLPKSSRFIAESLAEVGNGLKLYNLMVKYDLEGIVVKRLNGTYSRSTKWYKFKNKNYSQAKGRSRFF